MRDFGNMLRVVTRTEHRCEWCGEQIVVGTKCGNYRGMFQDEWQNWYMHPECEEVYSLNDDGEGFYPYENERPTNAKVAD